MAEEEARKQKQELGMALKGELAETIKHRAYYAHIVKAWKPIPGHLLTPSESESRRVVVPRAALQDTTAF
jgi:hypothetical protein